MVRLKLIEDRKNWRKYWSVQLAVLGGVLLTLAEAAPGYLHQAWSVLPMEFQQAVPDSIIKYVGIACVFLSPIARAIKQEKLNHDKKDN